MYAYAKYVHNIFIPNTFMSQALPTSVTHLKELFRRFDEDGDGYTHTYAERETDRELMS